MAEQAYENPDPFIKQMFDKGALSRLSNGQWFAPAYGLGGSPYQKGAGSGFIDLGGGEGGSNALRLPGVNDPNNAWLMGLPEATPDQLDQYLRGTVRGGPNGMESNPDATGNLYVNQAGEQGLNLMIPEEAKFTQDSSGQYGYAFDSANAKVANTPNLSHPSSFVQFREGPAPVLLGALGGAAGAYYGEAAEGAGGGAAGGGSAGGGSSGAVLSEETAAGGSLSGEAAGGAAAGSAPSGSAQSQQTAAAPASSPAAQSGTTSPSSNAGVMSLVKDISTVLSGIGTLAALSNANKASSNMKSAASDSPQVTPSITLPTFASPITRAAQQNSIFEQLMRRGRASTILTTPSGLGV